MTRDLREIIIEEGYTQDSLAKEMHMARSTLNRKLKNKSFTRSEMQLMIKLLKISPQESYNLFLL